MNRVRCGYCGEIVGVYEPMRLLLPEGGDRHGSPLMLGHELDVLGSTVVHERCYEAFDPGVAPRRNPDRRSSRQPARGLARVRSPA